MREVCNPTALMAGQAAGVNAGGSRCVLCHERGRKRSRLPRKVEPEALEGAGFHLPGVERGEESGERVDKLAQFRRLEGAERWISVRQLRHSRPVMAFDCKRDPKPVAHRLKRRAHAKARVQSSSLDRLREHRIVLDDPVEIAEPNHKALGQDPAAGELTERKAQLGDVDALVTEGGEHYRLPLEIRHVEEKGNASALLVEGWDHTCIPKLLAVDDQVAAWFSILALGGDGNQLGVIAVLLAKGGKPSNRLFPGAKEEGIRYLSRLANRL